MRRAAGILLTLAGIGFFIAGAVHPAGQPGQDFHAALTSMLRNPLWPVAHWCALTSAVAAAWSLFLLSDSGESPAAIAGIRLGVVAMVFMAVEFAVELAARADVARFAAGEPTAMVSMVDAMQAIGFPALAVAFVLVARSTRWTPRWVTVLAVIGAAALGTGGLVVQGLHVVRLGPVFLAGNLLPVWMIWAGVTLARRNQI